LGQAKNFFKMVVTSVAGTKAAAIDAAMQKHTETEPSEEDDKEKKEGNSTTSEEGV
jgi:hypothetical protein